MFLEVSLTFTTHGIDFKAMLDQEDIDWIYDETCLLDRGEVMRIVNQEVKKERLKHEEAVRKAENKGDNWKWLSLALGIYAMTQFIALNAVEGRVDQITNMLTPQQREDLAQIDRVRQQASEEEAEARRDASRY